MKKSKLIVLSADALVAEDMELFKTLPNFKKYLSGGACVKAVKTCYPTITYPAHTSIATGVYPDRHGITGNDVYYPEPSKRPWVWFHEYVKAKDIFTYAKEAGRTTAGVFWPVTGNHPDIDYLIDEYWSQGEGDTRRAAFERSGTSPEIMKIVERYVDTGWVERSHPGADIFVINCAADIIREYSPDLIMIHPANIDSYRHHNGLFNKFVDNGIRETDEWLGQLCRAAEDAGELQNTNVVLISDHGQLEIKRSIKYNVLLADAGFLTVENGKITDMKAYVRSGGMVAYCYVYDKAENDNVYKYLCHLKDEGIYGVSEVLTEAEAREKHRLGGEFDFVLETDGYTSFSEGICRPLTDTFTKEDYRLGRATHGYMPEKGPQPVFYAKGPDFKDGAELERCDTVDEAPTFARILGTEMKDVDGRILTELLNE